MAKGIREKIKLVSSAGTGHFYTTTKNKRTKPEKLELKKFDPVVRQHVPKNGVSAGSEGNGVSSRSLRGNGCYPSPDAFQLPGRLVTCQYLQKSNQLEL